MAKFVAHLAAAALLAVFALQATLASDLQKAADIISDLQDSVEAKLAETSDALEETVNGLAGSLQAQLDTVNDGIVWDGASGEALEALVSQAQSAASLAAQEALESYATAAAASDPQSLIDAATASIAQLGEDAAPARDVLETLSESYAKLADTTAQEIPGAIQAELDLVSEAINRLAADPNSFDWDAVEPSRIGAKALSSVSKAQEKATARIDDAIEEIVSV